MPVGLVAAGEREVLWLEGGAISGGEKIFRGVSGGWQATQSHVWRWRWCTSFVGDEKDRVMVIARRELAETAIEAPWR
jgi:hypothetical protein